MSVFGVRLGSCVYLCVGMSSCVCPIAYASGYISLRVSLILLNRPPLDVFPA